MLRSKEQGFLRWAARLLVALQLLPCRIASAEPAPPLPIEAEALPPLPAPPRLELAKPEAKDLGELDQRLTALESDESDARDSAMRELLEVKGRLVPAIAFRLQQLADKADKEVMKRLFSRIREEARDSMRQKRRAPGVSEQSEATDYLAMLLADRRASSKGYRELLQVVALSRMLTQIGSIEAARELIDVYVRFGEFLRIHTQRELTSLGERAVPALLEASKHPAEKISTWAKRQLDMLGRAVPGEAIQSTDPSVLADVLRAYGRLKNPDAARIIVSFAHSERAQVREAARQAIVLMGEVANWQLRDSYENTVGKRPLRDWSWDRTARELFAELDRMRSAAAKQDFDSGRTARVRGDFEAMRAAFDRALTKNPNLEYKEELAEAYLDYAARSHQEQPQKARLALFRAARLTDAQSQRQKIESWLLTLQAREELSRGLADETLLNRALELDPDNSRAQESLTQLRSGVEIDTSQRTRTLSASLVALGAFAALFVLLRRRPSRPVQG